MLNFTNGFNCAMDNEKGEVIINFLQQTPNLDADGNVQGMRLESVDSLVMGKVTAQQLVDSLSEILRQNSK